MTTAHDASPLDDASRERATPSNVLQDSVLMRRGAVQLFRLVQLATEIAAAPDLDSLLGTLSEGLTRLLQAERTTIYVHDQKTSEIWSRATDRLEIGEIRLPLGSGIAGEVARTRALQNVADVTKHESFNPAFDARTGFTTRSILAAPMLNLKRELIGVVEVMNKSAPGGFVEDDEELLRLFAGYAANALESALLEETVRRRERLAAVGSLAGTIVHDVRNVLSLVAGYLDMIKPSERDREIFEVIRGEIDKIVDLTSEVLEFARGGEPRLQPRRVDLDEALREVLRVLEREFEFSGVSLVLEAGNAGPVQLDLKRFRRVVMNLAQNARKVLPRGGTLVVRTSRRLGAAKIEFEDDGPGIPAEIRARLFTPFTSAGEQAGTGLGLAITRSIVEAHRGKISVRDRPPHGTVFEILLPGDQMGSGVHKVEMPPLGA